MIGCDDLGGWDGIRRYKGGRSETAQLHIHLYIIVIQYFYTALQYS